MNLLPKHSSGCPYLQLAPMEGVGDLFFRKAIATIGGFDEAVRDFLRVPKGAHVKSLAKVYDPLELFPIPLAAQIMGSDPELMAEMAVELQRRGAKRIDINCGCPSQTVTGRGAGSSLLKNPHFVHEVAIAVVKAVDIPVTIKMRTGFEDTSLFEENISAASESGARYITLHARTKVDGYHAPASWKYIAQAKSMAKIPIVGNGDIFTVQDALTMLSETGCDGLMVGRGSLINPFIFHEIKAKFMGVEFVAEEKALLDYCEAYLEELKGVSQTKTQVNKLKQLLGFLFKRSPQLLERRQTLLSHHASTPRAFLDFAKEVMKV